MKYLILALVATVAMISCGRTTVPNSQTVQKADSGLVQVLYFHGKQRCVTCNAIERLTREVVDSLSDKGVAMEVIYISQKENEALVDKYQVTWSSLILVRGQRSEDMTKVGFGYAKNQPQEFKRKLNGVIAQMRE